MERWRHESHSLTDGAWVTAVQKINFKEFITALSVFSQNGSREEKLKCAYPHPCLAIVPCVLCDLSP